MDSNDDKLRHCFFTNKISDQSDIENESHLGYFGRITTGAFCVFILNLKCKKIQQMKLPSRHASSAIISYLCTKFKQEIYISYINKLICDFKKMIS